MTPSIPGQPVAPDPCHDAAFDLPPIADPRDFDTASGGRLERLVFNHRGLVLLLAALLSALLGWHALQLAPNASFERMMPTQHPYVRHMLQHRDALRGLGNTVRVVMAQRSGTVLDAQYLQTLRRVHDKLYLAPGVDRGGLKSLWAPSVRWTEITEDGFRGGPVMPEDFDGSPAKLAQLQRNLQRAGLVGSLVSSDLASSMLVVPLLDRLPPDGTPLDVHAFARFLEDDIRGATEAGSGLAGQAQVKVHIVGFVKLAGDLIDGLTQVLGFFAISAAIAALCVGLYTRCLRSTLLLVATATLGVLWLLGLLQWLGYGLDPYSILVPFLIFAIGLSHGAQKMNGILQDVGRGTHRYVAARYTFRRLFTAGLTALLTNVVGFAVLWVVDIPVIRDLAVASSLGVLILIVTKLILVPVLLSYTGVSPRAAARAAARLAREQHEGQHDGQHEGHNTPGGWLQRLTERRYALPLVLGAGVLGLAAATVSLTLLQVGDLDAGAPELRPDSRYNRDAAFMTQHFGASSDALAVITTTPANGCDKYETLVEMDRLGWTLRQLPQVRSTVSSADGVRLITSGSFEGSPKWLTLNSNPSVTATAIGRLLGNNPELANANCSVSPVIAFLTDHKAQTLLDVTRAVEAFARVHDTPERQFLLGAGSAGIEAATNDVVRAANYRGLALLYAAVALLCWFTFRNWRAVLVAMLPLVITSFLCEALMVALGIGIKVATLPVIALGVGVGVDYALYLLSIQLAAQREGLPLAQAWARALRLTGRVVVLVGFTMAAGVVTWVASPLKFQADMGLLLTGMFLWNMVGALLLIPALSHFLLANVSERGAAMTERLVPIRHAGGALTLATETFGDRRHPAMLLIMGVGTQMLGWHDDLCRLLADTGHFVVRFDNRDIGRSTKFDLDPLPNLPWALLRMALGLPVKTPYRLADMALDVVGLMDALGLARAHIVGASMGGMIGQLVAAHHAERVRTFTCIMSSAGAPRLSDSAPRARRALLSRPQGSDRVSLIEHEVAVRLACSGPLPAHPDDLRAWAARCLDRQVDTAGKQRQFLCARASGSQLADVAKIRLPTLYLHGMDDPLIPPRQSQQLQAHTPGAELVLLPDMGHDLPRALWPELVQRIAAHCARA